MMMKRLLLGSALLLAPVDADAQVLRGLVLDEASGVPVPGAVVQVLWPGGDTAGSVVTDRIGSFRMRLARAGPVELHVAHASFIPTGAMHVNVERETVVEIRLGGLVVPLSPLTARFVGDVRLAGFHERMQQAGSGQFLTRADIARQRSSRVTDMLRTMRGVEILPGGSGMMRPRSPLIVLRGLVGRCSPTIYVDGLTIRQFPDSGIDDMLTADLIYGVEVYTGSASVPSQFTARDGCGVVAFWTRPVDDVEPWNWTRMAIGGGAVAGLILLVLFTR